jgi:hypothetical protein
MSRNSASAQYVHRARVTLPSIIGEEKPWTKGMSTELEFVNI